MEVSSESEEWDDLEGERGQFFRSSKTVNIATSSTKHFERNKSTSSHINASSRYNLRSQEVQNNMAIVESMAPTLCFFPFLRHVCSLLFLFGSFFSPPLLLQLLIE